MPLLTRIRILPAACLLAATLQQIVAVSGGSSGARSSALPIVANTWAFTNATESAWKILIEGSRRVSAVLDAVEQVDLLGDVS